MPSVSISCAECIVSGNEPAVRVLEEDARTGYDDLMSENDGAVNVSEESDIAIGLSGLSVNLWAMQRQTVGMNPLFARLVPFAAVGTANFINIPIMRSNELMNGTPVFTPDGQRVGNSKIAAYTGIFLVCLSRVAMAVPAMTLVPMMTNAAVQRCIFCPNSKSIIPFQLFMVALCSVFATPLCCALFSQKADIAISSIEPPLKETALKLSPKTSTVYYNKGL